MDRITIKDANIVEYIKRTKKDNIINSVIELMKNNPDYLLKDFIKGFLQQYDKTCKYFITFYEDLFDDIQLTNFHKYSFVLEV